MNKQDLEALHARQQLLDRIADMKIAVAALPSLPPSLRARINAWLDDYYGELAGSIGQIS